MEVKAVAETALSNSPATTLSATLLHSRHGAGRTPARSPWPATNRLRVSPEDADRSLRHYLLEVVRCEDIDKAI